MPDTPFRPALEIALQSALEYLEQLESSPVSASATLQELRTRLDKTLNEYAIPAHEVLEDLVRDTRGGLLGSAGGRFFAWAIGGSVPAALGADWLTSAWDQNAALYACAPAAAVVEEVAGAWLKKILGLPTSTSFAFVSGCQMAHVTCLAAARHELLAQRGWNVETDGMRQFTTNSCSRLQSPRFHCSRFAVTWYRGGQRSRSTARRFGACNAGCFA